MAVSHWLLWVPKCQQAVIRSSKVVHFENAMKAALPNSVPRTLSWTPASGSERRDQSPHVSLRQVFLNIFDLAFALSIPNWMLCNTMLLPELNRCVCVQLCYYGPFLPFLQKVQHNGGVPHSC